MTYNEMNNAAIREFDSLKPVMERFGNEYDRLRKKLKIKPENEYSKCYHYKSKSHNEWIFIFSKAQSAAKYKGLAQLSFTSLIVYNTELGKRVIKIGAGVDVATTTGCYLYNPHLFSRYAERMNLDISKPIETIKHFFINNSYTKGQIIPKEGREYAINVCKDGFILGEIAPERVMCINKTFITRNEAKTDQMDLESHLINSLQKEIEELLNESDFDKHKYQLHADVATALSKK